MFLKQGIGKMKRLNCLNRKFVFDSGGYKLIKALSFGRGGVDGVFVQFFR